MLVSNLLPANVIRPSAVYAAPNSCNAVSRSPACATDSGDRRSRLRIPVVFRCTIEPKL